MMQARIRKIAACADGEGRNRSYPWGRRQGRPTGIRRPGCGIRRAGPHRLHHVSLWYQLAVAYSQLIPLLGPALSRLREYSCDRHGAWLSPLGATGLVVLASGRNTETEVDLDQLVQQGRWPRGFWVGLAHLPRSHPFTVRRLARLYDMGLFHADVKDAETRV